jgi:hypothetical protein
MGDYYPLMTRAIAGLERNTGDSRRMLYERARSALAAQLRGVTPALSAADVSRERLKLEEAIRKIEAESARQTLGDQAQTRPLTTWRAEANPPTSDPLAEMVRLLEREKYIDPIFDEPIAGRDRIRPVTPRPAPPRVPDSQSGLERLAGLREELDKALESARSSRRQPKPDPELVRLLRALPEQKLAPAQFEIQANRIVLKNVPSSPAPQDRKNVLAAKEGLEASGKRLLKEIQKSNFDRRLAETIEYVQEIISDGANIIKLGVSNIEFGMVCTALAKELPDAILAKLRAHALNIDMYVAQFPEWKRFVENAADTQLAEEDIKALHHSVGQLIQNMEKEPELVAPEVPKTLLHLREMIGHPKVASRRAAYAVWRSLENFVKGVLRYVLDVAEAVRSKSVKVVSNVVVAALLAWALNSATSIGPIARKFGEQWLDTALEVGRKELEAITKKQ